MFSSLVGTAQTYTGDRGVRSSGFENDTTVSDKANTVTTCLTDQRNGEIEVTQHRHDGSVDVTVLPGEFPTGEAKVIFQDASYNPDKAVGEAPPLIANLIPGTGTTCSCQTDRTRPPRVAAPTTGRRTTPAASAHGRTVDRRRVRLPSAGPSRRHTCRGQRPSMPGSPVLASSSPTQFSSCRSAGAVA